jgi:hypothetical protein
MRCKLESGQKVAVLIDEYDTPVTDLLETPAEAELFRIFLREFYRQLKVCDDYISFMFVTGITKNVKGGLFSAFNTTFDISLDPKYGAITGFTHDEIKRYYPRQIQEVAQKRKTSPEALLEGMKDYYNGFCFDGQTLVYNPFSTLLFFEEKKFKNFWFESGTPDQLISFFKTKKYKLDKFQNITISSYRLSDPTFNRNEDPEAYLYQLGYLSQRPSQSANECVLDYPNREVFQSMARRLLQSYFGSAQLVDDLSKSLKSALAKRDPVALVDAFNARLKEMSYRSFPSKNKPKVDHDTVVFYANLFDTAFCCVNSRSQAEKAGHLGVADFVVTYEGQSWVIELKVSRNERNFKKLAKAALNQIITKDYVGNLDNPVLLGLVVSDQARLIKAWEHQDGIEAKPEAPTVAVEAKKEEKKPSGPRSR